MNILVTGGSGTVGRAICAQLVALGHQPIALCRDLGAQLENCRGCLHEIGDIERRSDLERAFNFHQIDGVIHAAALKHVNLCETRPTLAARANILGTLNLLELCLEQQIGRVVLISTDKACNHLQIYGMSKYFGERMAEEYACSGLRVNCIRFGNVFGSQGSVVPIWRREIQAGRAIHCRMEYNPGSHGASYPLRFAMLPSEAAAFCVQVYLGDYPPGAVVVKPMRVLNVRTLAQVMTRGTGVPIRDERIEEGESIIEYLLTKEERSRASLDDQRGEWVIAPSYSRRGNQHYWLDVRTEEAQAMGEPETADFLARVLEEM